MKFYNTNERFSEFEIFEAANETALLEDMHELFETWTYEELINITNIETATDAERVNIKNEICQRIKNEFIAGLVPQYSGLPQIIFDNAGGIILQLPGFAHYYNADVKSCVEDILEWYAWETTNDWEGDEVTCHSRKIDDSDVVYTPDDLLNMSPRVALNQSSCDVRAVYRALVAEFLK